MHSKSTQEHEMKPLILVVDDEDETRLMLRILLELKGFQVEEAVDGLDALKKVHEVNPAVMILDVMMPNMDGLTVCRKLRSQPETANLPVIMLSGKTHLNADVEGLAAGANAYMSKPANIKKLVENVNHLLAQRLVPETN